MSHDRIIDLFWGNSCNFDAIEAAGVKAIIHKASEGTFLPLESKKNVYAQRKKEALSRKLLWGAYHLTSDEPPADQLAHFLKFEDGSDPRVLMAIDWEESSNGTILNLQEVRDLVLLFADHFGGRFPVLYAGHTVRFNDEVIHGDSILGNCPLWYQQYSLHDNVLPADAEPKALPKKTWDDYTIWQYSDENVRLYGGPRDTGLGGADWNRWRGTLTELQAEWPFAVKVDLKKAKELAEAVKKATERAAALAKLREGEGHEGPGLPPTGFASRLVQSAVGEWELFGRQERDRSGHTIRVGRKEGQDGMWQRVARYWKEGVNRDDVDGRDHDEPWSAAFISWNERQAGAEDRFFYNAQHSQYIYKSIRDFRLGTTGVAYYGRRLNEYKPQVGDLVCWERDPSKDTNYDRQHGGDYKGHCDIVVEVRSTEIDIIGGNVGDSVTRRVVPLNGQGHLEEGTIQNEFLFALMQNLLG